MALASLIQLVAVLTNDYEYMKKTNMVGTEFDDIWTVPYCSRTHIKKALTPKLYGSGKHTRELWDNNKLEYTQVQLNKISEDINTGANQVNRLGVMTVGNTLKLYINGVPQGEVSDSTFTAGFFGTFVRSVTSSRYVVKFDEMKYWENPTR